MSYATIICFFQTAVVNTLVQSKTRTGAENGGLLKRDALLSRTSRPGFRSIGFPQLAGEEKGHDASSALIMSDGIIGHVRRGRRTKKNFAGRFKTSLTNARACLLARRTVSSWSATEGTMRSGIWVVNFLGVYKRCPTVRLHSQHGRWDLRKLQYVQSSELKARRFGAKFTSGGWENCWLSAPLTPAPLLPPLPGIPSVERV